ncbi:MAG: hypothetical protein U1E81_09625 [Xanthobacteraceae bacterium]
MDRETIYQLIEAIFQRTAYLSRYQNRFSDKTLTAQCAAADFLDRSKSEDISPIDFFDSAWFRSKYDVTAVNAFLSYLARRDQRIAWPSPLFAPTWYCRRYKIDHTMENPLLDFLLTRDLKSPHPLLDVDYLKEQTSQWQSDAIALEFLTDVHKYRLNPHPAFDSSWYLNTNPDVAQAGINPLTHYLYEGYNDGRLPNKAFDAAWPENLREHLVSLPDRVPQWIPGVENAAKLDPGRYPLIIYVHVPKTAGTSVKKFLRTCAPRGHEEIHTLVELEDYPLLLDTARNADWIAGHVQRDTLAAALVWHHRPIEYFATVREPIAQLVSNLNFSFERYNRGDYYDSVDVDTNLRDADVISTDFTNPATVIGLLLRYHELFLNVQSRLILGTDFMDISESEASYRLAGYTYIATEYDLPKLYRAFGFAWLPDGADLYHENISKRYLNPSVFESPEMRGFLAKHHCHDQQLYTMVCGAKWPAEGRAPFRPALCNAQVVTPENFDEIGYLETNPDIACAVARGEFASGRDHFDAVGRLETRHVGQWVFPSPVPVF